jgi:hypothetical protein
MKRNLKNISLTLFFVFLTLAPLYAEGSYKFHREIKKTYDAKPGMKLSVSGRNGKIEIEKWDKDQVEIFATVGSNKSMEELDKIDIDISVDENIVIETRYPGYKSKKKGEKSYDEEDFSFWDLIKTIISSGVVGSGVSVDYEIKVPEYVVVSNVNTTNGEIDLEGTKGPSKLSTTNGKIEVENVEGDIKAHSTNGKIEIEKAKGIVTASTTNGKIEVKSEGIKNLTTTNGGIEAEIKKLEKEDINIRTTNGSITIALPASLNSVLELSTTNGGIDLDGITLEVIAQHKNKYIKGTMGKGGPKINASTTNGSIKIGKL